MKSAVAGVSGFAACRGPAHRLIDRYGPRVGLTTARVGRAALSRNGRGSGSRGARPPGLRTLTVIAAGVSGVRGRRALPALILGSSVFLQLHLVLGLLLGPLAVRAFDQAKGPALAAIAALAVAMAAFWLAKRRRRATWTEAVCPACIGLRLLAERAPALAGLTGDDAAPVTARPGGGTAPDNGQAAEIPEARAAGKPVLDYLKNPGTRRG